MWLNQVAPYVTTWRFHMAKACHSRGYICIILVSSKVFYIFPLNFGSYFEVKFYLILVIQKVNLCIFLRESCGIVKSFFWHPIRGKFIDFANAYRYQLPKTSDIDIFVIQNSISMKFQSKLERFFRDRHHGNLEFYFWYIFQGKNHCFAEFYIINRRKL